MHIKKNSKKEEVDGTLFFIYFDKNVYGKFLR